MAAVEGSAGHMRAHSEKFGDGNLHLRLLHQGPADVEPLSVLCCCAIPLGAVWK